VIVDEAFFYYLETHVDALLRKDEDAVAHVIARSCAIKAEVVMADERETDRRRILNYGHTVGHALESLGHYRSLMHGEAVAIGMVAEAEIAECLGLCRSDVVARQRALISRIGLPTSLPSVTFPDLWEAIQHDKKVAGGRIYCVLPDHIGRVQIAPLERAAFKAWFDRREQKGRT
jgi:3-dehydroquinate synthase